MSWHYVKPARSRLTADADIAPAHGYREVEGDTQYGDITATLCAWTADGGPVLIVKGHASNTLTVALDGGTVNGETDDIELTDIGASLLLIPGTTEWRLFEPLAIG